MSEFSYLKNHGEQLMSYDFKFVKNGEVCRLPFSTPHGGTYCIDPEYNEAKLNMTYNYHKIMFDLGITAYRHKDDPKGIYVIEGKKASSIAKKLAEVIPKLKDEVDPDYWKPTEGNVKKALSNLLLMAVSVPPDAKCEVS